MYFFRDKQCNVFRSDVTTYVVDELTLVSMVTEVLETSEIEKSLTLTSNLPLLVRCQFFFLRLNPQVDHPAILVSLANCSVVNCCWLKNSWPTYVFHVQRW